MSSSESGDSIATRISRLNHLIQGKAGDHDCRALLGREGLLDALLVLFSECNQENLLKNSYVAAFVKKYAKTISELKQLRLGTSDFEVKNVIGRGHFGEVQVVREKHTGDVYALKVLRKADTLAQQNVAFYEEERDIMAKAASPWITRLQYAFQNQNNLYLVMEFHPGGDLLQLLSRFDDVFEESMARFYLAEMVLGVHTLHTMGYVHRDVKPENILIDRTGHIKLADFGSACRLDDPKSSVSNMPVGTPDYISPEVLTKINSAHGAGKFSTGCDWWSLGICAYEMLFGKTPFTDEGGSMVTTYANIMNFKNCLKFTDDVEVSQAALDMIKKLLTDAESRLDYEKICVHRFFSDVDFDSIRHTRPPFIPTVTSRDDTSNFEEFEKLKPPPCLEDLDKKTGFTGRDLPFIGFTFTKEVVNLDRSFAISDISSPACKSSMERRLAAKSREIQELKKKLNLIENRDALQNAELNTVRSKASDNDRLLHKVEAERDALERNMVHYIAENKSLQRQMEQQKEEQCNIDSQATKLLMEIRAEDERAQKLRDENIMAEVEEHKEIIQQLEEDIQAETKKTQRLEKELGRQRKHIENKDEHIKKLEARLAKAKASSKQCSEDLNSEIDVQEQNFRKREQDLQAKLDKALQQNVEATQMLEQVRQSKNDLEKELHQIRLKLGLDETLKSRLVDCEEKRKSLETQLHKLRLMEQREEQLKGQLQEKSEHVRQLAETIGELEERSENRELEYKTCEKLYNQRQTQLENRVQDLLQQLDLIRNEKHDIEEQSMIVFEDNEERMHTIHEQEATISILKNNVILLEKQISLIREDAESRARHYSPVRRTPKRPLKSSTCQTDTPSSPYNHKRRRSSETDTPSPSLMTQSDAVQTEPCDTTSCFTQTTSPLKSTTYKKQTFDTRNQSCSPMKQSYRKQADHVTRMSGCTQTDSPVRSRKYSGSTQTESVLNVSGMTQTESPFVSYSRRSNQAQTDAFVTTRTPRSSFSCQTEPVQRVSGVTQTESPFLSGSRRSNQAQTDSFVTTRTSRSSFSTQTETSPGKTRQESRTTPTKKRSNLTQASPKKTDRIRTEVRMPLTKRDGLDVNVGQSHKVTVEVRVRRRLQRGQGDFSGISDESSMTQDTIDEEEESYDDSNDNEEESPDNTVLYQNNDEEYAAQAENDRDIDGLQTENLKKIVREEKKNLVIEKSKSADAESEEDSDSDDDKETRRRLREKLSDLRQEKLFLEKKVEALEREVAQIKDGTHQQRIRALDLKHDLREKTTEYEKQIDDLKQQLNKTEMSLGEATETANNCRKKETSLRMKLEKLQEELDKLKLSSRHTATKLQEERDDLDAEVKTLTSKCNRLEESEAKMQRNFNEINVEFTKTKKQCSELLPKNKELEDSLRMALQEKTRCKLNADRSQDELVDKKRQVEQLNQQLIQLKELCHELESQVQDFEDINKRYEDKEAQWKNDKSVYERAVGERDSQADQTHRLYTLEKQARQRAEEREQSTKKCLENTQTSYKAEIERQKKHIAEQKVRIDILNNQLTQIDREFSLLGVDNKNLQRKVEALELENIRLKEEISKLITKNGDLKTSNLKLSKNLEEAMDKYEMLENEKIDLENHMETILANHSHEIYRNEATLSQQTKLIEYLQTKVENPPKKKRGLFGGKRQDTPTMSIQFREMQHSLEHERDKNASLRQQILRLKDELYQAKTESLRLKSKNLGDGVDTPASNPLTTPGSHPALAALALSPCHQPSPGSGVPEQGTLPRTPTGRPKKERMHHNIPHRFVTGLNSKATKCAVCLGPVQFVSQASKCQECNIVAHPRCAPSLPASCGLPTEYAKHFTDTLRKAKALSSSKQSVANLHLQMEGGIKVPRANKQSWEKKEIVLENNILRIYDKTGGKKMIEEFDLCPSNGEVSVHSAVSAAELNNTASSDMPYILMLKFEPNTTCWPGRTLYLMALSFSEKQKWVATLEAIVNHSGKEERLSNAKVLGNTVLIMTGKTKQDVNCTLPITEKSILIGRDDGLFVMDVSVGTVRQHMLSQVDGVHSVHAMEDLDDLDKVALVTGKSRKVVLLDKPTLRRCAKIGNNMSVHPQSIEGATECTTFVCGNLNGGVYMCVATAEEILVFKYNNSLNTFSLRKEMRTSQACSCLHFTKTSIIIGTDRFYEVDPHSYTITEFLDKSDTSLAFAAFGAAHYESFPIAILLVSPEDEPEEFLLCFHEFGVFVDNHGQRSRQKDMKWSGLPLAFDYREPYLYTLYFNAMQVIEILPRFFESVQGAKTFMNLGSPRFLGPALTPGAVYVGTYHENVAEVICFKGNLSYRRVSDTETETENEIAYSAPNPVKKSSSKSRVDTDRPGFVSPEKTIETPVLRRMSKSPRSARRPRPPKKPLDTHTPQSQYYDLMAEQKEKLRHADSDCSF